MDTDEDLLVLSMREPARFEALVTAHSVALHGYFSRRAPGAADDLLAEVWLAAFAARGGFDPSKGSARGWLFGVARNVLLTHLRRTAAPPPASGGPAEDGWDAVDARLDAALVAKRIRAALATLPAVERELLLLVAWEQLSPAQAAQVLGAPAGTARSRLHRARARMRGYLEPEQRTTGYASPSMKGPRP